MAKAAMSTRGKPSQALVQAMQQRLTSLTRSHLCASQEAGRLNRQELSTRAKADWQWDKEIKKCWALLESIGSQSPKWLELQQPSLPECARGVQEDIFKGSNKVEQVQSLRKEAESLLFFLTCIRVEWCKATVLQVASFLRDKRAQSKTSPARAFRGLKWLERVSGMCFHSEEDEVSSQAMKMKTGFKPDAPEAALTPSIEMVKAMEQSVTCASTSVLRCVAGLICVLAWGCVRWHDVQHTDKVTVTKDALLFHCFDMKGKPTAVTFAALRVGASGDDWGSRWLQELHVHGLPGPDYLILRPQRNAAGFLPAIAEYNDINSAMRLLLQEQGFSAEESLKWTLHSWRHWMPTCSRQLRHPDSETNECGHWSIASDMPRKYDQSLCCTELLIKNDVRKAIKRGWSMAEAGEIPSKKPRRRSPNSSRLVVGSSHQTSAGASGSDDLPAIADKIAVSEACMPRVVRVLHTVTKRVHFWTSGQASLCTMWTCGSPKSPANCANFEDMGSSDRFPLSAGQCKPCAARASTLSGWDPLPSGLHASPGVVEKAVVLPEVPSSEDED